MLDPKDHEINSSSGEARQRQMPRNAWMLLFLIAIGTAAASLVFFNGSVFGDGDTGWHLAVGEFIWHHRSIPETDPFSYSFRGAPWVAHEWLTDILMYLAFRLGGWAGLAILFGLAFAAFFAIFGYFTARRMSFLGSIALCVLLVSILGPMLLIRPHVFGWLALVIWTVALLERRDQNLPPPYWLVPVMLVWANMHGSYVIGLGIAGALGLEAFMQAAPPQRKRVLLDWGVFGSVSLAAACLTPHGLAGIVFPFQVSSMKTLPMIVEWQASNFGSDAPFFIFVLLGAFVLFRYTIRLGLIRALMFIGLLAYAFAHARHQAIFAIVGLLLIAQPLAVAFMGDMDGRPLFSISGRGGRKLATILVCIAVIVFVGLSGWRLATPFERPQSQGNPRAAIAAVPEVLRSYPVFNTYSFGGALIHAGIPVFIDGRADMYGDAWMEQYDRITDVDPKAWQQAQKRWDFGWTIVPPKLPITDFLDAQPDWQRVYADGYAVIHVRRDVLKELPLCQSSAELKQRNKICCLPSHCRG